MLPSSKPISMIMKRRRQHIVKCLVISFALHWLGFWWEHPGACTQTSFPYDSTDHRTHAKTVHAGQPELFWDVP